MLTNSSVVAQEKESQEEKLEVAENKGEAWGSS